MLFFREKEHGFMCIYILNKVNIDFVTWWYGKKNRSHFTMEIHQMILVNYDKKGEASEYLFSKYFDTQKESGKYLKLFIEGSDQIYTTDDKGSEQINTTKEISSVPTDTTKKEGGQPQLPRGSQPRLPGGSQQVELVTEHPIFDQQTIGVVFSQLPNSFSQI